MVKLSDLRSCRANRVMGVCRDAVFYVSTEEVTGNCKLQKKLCLSARWIAFFYVYAQIAERLLGLLGIKFAVAGQP